MKPVVSLYQASLVDFLSSDENSIIGSLTAAATGVDAAQLDAWQIQIGFLKQSLASIARPAHIYFEFFIPRMGKRADVVLLIEGTIVVIEFKVHSSSFDLAARDQAHDYSLDLKNFHHGSHHLPILPLLIATSASEMTEQHAYFARDGVAFPVNIATPAVLAAFISDQRNVPAIPDPIALDADTWAHSGYKPTPTIVEAAQALYRQHSVEEITRSDAGAKNLSVTNHAVDEIIDRARSEKFKAICFITGVPGSGKTLAGLNIATQRADAHVDEHATFLSGNGPLVDVLREALARDKAEREGVTKKHATQSVHAFIQNVHHFRNSEIGREQPPAERVVIFDEAQRAWDNEQATKFMQKRGFSDFNSSEPEFLISVMDRHQDWAVIVCLIGGGQEINTGEAGIAEWFSAISRRFPHWRVFGSNRLDDPDYIRDEVTDETASGMSISLVDGFHLSVAVRSFRAEALAEFVGHVVENRPAKAKATLSNIQDKYPIFLTRSLSEARCRPPQPRPARP